MNEITSSGAVVGGVKTWLKFEGALVFVLSVLLYSHTGLKWGLFFVFFLFPDLSMLPYLANPRAGAMSYNLFHTYSLPLAIAAFALTFHHSALLPYTLIWTAHIGIDRFLGYGLKYPEAFGRTHLGVLGKTAPTTD
ncbi:MAG: DUF4260 domain-containing protein [Candidatus Acidiferrales bacterium]|jgi:uncharacterized protein DUF4260